MQKLGVSNAYKVQKLNQLIRGWINYFKIGSMKGLCDRLDSNIRYRLRMCIWKHWKTPKNRAKNLIKLGISRKYTWSTAYSRAELPLSVKAWGDEYGCYKRETNPALD